MTTIEIPLAILSVEETIETIDLNKVPSWTRWIAVDSHGAIWAYELEPEIDIETGDYWFRADGDSQELVSPNVSADFRHPVTNWKSLIYDVRDAMAEVRNRQPLDKGTVVIFNTATGTVDTDRGPAFFKENVTAVVISRSYSATRGYLYLVCYAPTDFLANTKDGNGIPLTWVGESKVLAAYNPVTGKQIYRKAGDHVVSR